MADDEDVAMTIPEAFVYKIPPRQTAGGHKASDWTEQVAVVRVQVVTKGRDYFVRLIRPDSGKVFAIAPTRYGSPSAVEQTTDSSRYFALRIEDGKGALAALRLGMCGMPMCCACAARSPPPSSPNTRELASTACTHAHAPCTDIYTRPRRQPRLYWAGL